MFTQLVSFLFTDFFWGFLGSVWNNYIIASLNTIEMAFFKVELGIVNI